VSEPASLKEAETYLSTRGIHADVAAKYGVVLEVSPTPEQLKVRLNQDFNGDRPKCVLWFDAGWSEDGGTWVPNTWIARPFPPILRGGKLCKFLNAADREQRPYILPPSWQQTHNLLVPVVIAEGPTRSLLLVQNGFCAIAVAGVWNVTAKRTVAEEQQNGKFKAHADLLRWMWNGRRVLLGYDQDYLSNQIVLHAVIRNVVLFSSLGAEVAILRWDITKGKGLDDLVAAEAGLDLEQQKTVLDRVIADALPAAQFLKPAHVDLVSSELGRIEMTQSKRYQLAKEWAKPLHTTAEALRGSKKEAKTSSAGGFNGFIGADPEEPWTGKVDLADVLWEMLELLRSYVVLDEYKAVIRIFWDVFTWGYKDAFYLPLLTTVSPEPECGKTAAMEIDVALCRNSFRGASISDGSIHRLVGTFHPTLFVDEAENIIKDRPNTVAVLNAGYQHGTPIPRFNTETGLFEVFECACPKAVTGIGSFLGEATASRCLIIRMTRATREELKKVRDIAFFDPMGQVVIDLRRQVLAWFIAHREEYGLLCRQIMLEMPEEIRARRKNSFSSLFAIAKLAGDWTPALSQAALLLLEDNARHAQVSLEHRLLMDCYLVIITHPELITLEVEKRPFIKTDDLIQQLHGLPETPWVAMPKNGKPLTSEKLFYLLKEYEIRSAKNTAQTKRGIYIEHLLRQAEKFGNPPPQPPSSNSPSSPPFDGPGGAPASSGGGVSPEFTEKKAAYTPHNPSYPSYPSCSRGENLLGDRTGRTGRTGCEGYTRPFFLENLPAFTGLIGKWDRPDDSLAKIAAYFSAFLGSPSQWLALDIETFAPPVWGKNKKKPLKTNHALNPWIGSIRLITFADSEQIRQYDLKDEFFPAKFWEPLAAAGWISHNAKFELLYLKLHFEISPPTVFCTRIANALITNGLLHHAKEEETAEIKPPQSKRKKKDSLNSYGKALADRLGVALPKDQSDSDWGGDLTEAQHEYSLDDVRYLNALASKQLSIIRADGLETVCMLEMLLLPVVTKMEAHGFAVDREKLKERQQNYFFETEKKKAHAETLLGTGCPKLGDNRKENGLLDWIEKQTGKRLPNMQEATLESWEHPISQAIVDYKRTQKRLVTFEALLKHSALDGRVHPSLNQMGTVTGRFSCAEPNAQQMEKTANLFRDCYIASGPDRCLVASDFKHIEMRTGAIFAHAASGLRTLLDLFLAGLDPHTMTAAAVLSKAAGDITKTDRQLAKAVNFGFLYGQQALGFLSYAKKSYGVILTLPEAETFRRDYFLRYPDLAEWHRWAWNEVDTVTESRTILGRRHLIPPNASKWNKFQALVNTPASGSTADLIKWSMIELDRVLPIDTYLVMSVHDELVCDAPVHRAREIKELMERVMTETFAKLFDDTIPGPAEASFGPNWEAAKP
jgi:DNA polymerase I-like protein with 3'-5' exonuclease and polymerase domains